jgi:fructose-specific phosphotransferase system IIC component
VLRKVEKLVSNMIFPQLVNLVVKVIIENLCDEQKFVIMTWVTSSLKSFSENFIIAFLVIIIGKKRTEVREMFISSKREKIR